MTTAAIDLDILNELFDNQKKLDAIFNSAFDDDAFLSSSPPVPSPARRSSSQKTTPSSQYNDDLPSFYTEDSLFEQKKRSLTHLAIPVVLEIIAIYFIIMNLT